MSCELAWCTCRPIPSGPFTLKIIAFARISRVVNVKVAFFLMSIGLLRPVKVVMKMNSCTNCAQVHTKNSHNGSKIPDLHIDSKSRQHTILRHLENDHSCDFPMQHVYTA